MVWFFDRLRNGGLGRRCLRTANGAQFEVQGSKFKVPGLSVSTGLCPKNRFCPVLPGLIFAGAGARPPVPNRKKGQGEP